MGKINTGISIDENTLSQFDEIRETIGEESELASKPDRSEMIEDAMEGWIEKNAHYLDDDE